MALVTTLTVLVLLLRFDPGTNPEARLASASSAPAVDSMGGDPVGTAANGSAQVTGDAVTTRFGTVQVEIDIAGGALVDVTALQLPSGGRDSQVSAYAEPILRSEALQAGSASIDTVSGATYTSMGYIESLQSALDQAGIG
jgi:uncharacterized protein with FMN-binding domain